MRLEVLINKPFDAIVTAKVEEVEVTPVAASFSVLDRDGNTVQSTSVATISGSDIVMPLSAIATIGENYRINYQFSFNGRTHHYSIGFDVVKLLLNSLVTEDDILRAQPRLANMNFESEVDWSWARLNAWEELIAEIRAKGRRPALAFPASDHLKLPHLYLTLSKIFQAMYQEVGDVWHELYTQYSVKYDKTMGDVLNRLEYDEDEDGNVDDNVVVATSTMTSFTR